MRKLFICLLFAAPVIVTAQQVHTTGGGYHANPTTAISYTIGEPVIATATTASTMLTQGFQQPWADITTVVDEPQAEGPSINVYPNPVRHTLHIALDTDVIDHRYALHDAAGKLVTEGRIGSTITDLDMETYASGSYVLRVLGPKDNSVRSFKISVTH